MATTIGNETEPLDLLCKLIELDYDAIEAYDAAIERVEELETQSILESFRADHERHTRDLAPFVRELSGTPPTEGDLKRILTKGKVVIASLAGDHAILQAMKTNEDDTNTAYERAVRHEKVDARARAVLERNLADERRHRAWIEERLRRPFP